MIIVFSIAICDDEPVICAGIRHILNRHKEAVKISVSEFHTGEALCESIRSGVSYGLIILDIELKSMNGVAVGKLLREELKDSVTQILYISGKQGYAMELFDLHPLNFLLKPLDAGKLLHCVDEAMEVVNQNLPCFAFTAQRAVYRIPYREIRYFESRNKTVVVHTMKDEYSYVGKLSDIEKEVPSGEFIRIHHSYLVHRPYIRRMQYEQLTLDDGTVLSISQAYRKEVRELLFQLFLQKR